MMQRMTEEEFESILEELWKVQTTGVGFQMTANESLAIQGWRKHKTRAEALEAENRELKGKIYDILQVFAELPLPDGLKQEFDEAMKFYSE